MSGASKTLPELFPWESQTEVLKNLRGLTRAIESRLAALDILKVGLTATINATREVALARINAVLTPIIDKTRDDVLLLAAQAAQTTADIAAGLASFENQTEEALTGLEAEKTAALSNLANELSTALTNLQAQIDTKLASADAQIDLALDTLSANVAAVQARVDEILAGGLSASDVNETATRVFVTPAQLGLIQNSKDRLDAILAASDINFDTFNEVAVGLASKLPKLPVGPAARIVTTKTDGTVQDSGLSFGTAANNIVQIASDGKLPTLDGSRLINLPVDQTIAQDARGVALMVAELKGDRVNMKDGIADPFTDASDINSVSSSPFTLTTGRVTLNLVYGANIAVSAKAIGSSRPEDYPKVFDANNTTGWYMDPSPTSKWIGQDFGAASPKKIRKVEIRYSGTSASQGSDYGNIEYSDDLTNWVVAVSDQELFPKPGSTGIQENVFTVPDVGAHRAWRFKPSAVFNTNGGAYVYEMRMYEPAVGLNNLISAPFASQIGVPTTARVALQLLNSDAAALSGDIIASASRDGGASFASFSIAKSMSLADGTAIYEGSTSLTSIGSGSSLVWRVQAANAAVCVISGIVLQWRL